MSSSSGLLPRLVVSALVIGLFVLLWRRLRNSQYGRAEAVCLVLVGLAQPAYTGAKALQSACLALAAYAVTVSAEGFLQRQDPRRIVVLGGSLAGAQLANPVWGTVTTLLLPLALRKSVPAGGAKRLVGLYLSLVFIPFLMALTLLTLSARGQIVVPWWPPFGGIFSVNSLEETLAVLAIVCPMALRSSTTLTTGERIPIAVCCLIVATSALSELFGSGFTNAVLQCGAIVGVLTLCVVTAWPADPFRVFKAGLTVGALPVACWLWALTIGAPYG